MVAGFLAGPAGHPATLRFCCYFHRLEKSDPTVIEGDEQVVEERGFTGRPVGDGGLQDGEGLTMREMSYGGDGRKLQVPRRRWLRNSREHGRVTMVKEVLGVAWLARIGVAGELGGSG
jgi:hypothetical protein